MKFLSDVVSALSHFHVNSLPIKKMLQCLLALTTFALIAVIGNSSARWLGGNFSYEPIQRIAIFDFNREEDVYYPPEKYLPGIKQNAFATFMPALDDEPAEPFSETVEEAPPPPTFNVEDYELRGTLIWKEARLATVMDKNSGETSVFSLGEPFFDTDGEVFSIEKKKIGVKIASEGKVYDLRFPEEEDPFALLRNESKETVSDDSVEPPEVASPPPSPKPQQELAEAPPPIDPTHSEILFRRQEIDDILNNQFGKLLSEARVVPKVEDGEVTGYTIKRIVPGSFYEKLGLKNEDVIKMINGQSIASPEKALALFRLLRNESTIYLEIEREQKPVSFTYFIQ